MRSMGDPLYVYKPQSKKTKRQRSRAARKRLGIPWGHHRVYGVDVPVKFVKAVKYIVVRRIYVGKHSNPLRCVPRDLATEFTLEALKRVVTLQDVSDEAMLKVAREIMERHGRKWTLKRAYKRKPKP